METKILNWAFPWLMALLEFLLRQSLQNTDALTFIGPTVGGAALGMMLPFTRARELHRIGLHAAGMITFDRQEDRWAQRENLAVWIGLTAWAVSLYLSLTYDRGEVASVFNVPISISIGVILWLASVIFDILQGAKNELERND